MVSPNGPFASNSFFRPKTISKVAIIKPRVQRLLFFFSSPPFLLLALSFIPFSFVTVILELLGLKKRAFWCFFTQTTANFVWLVFKTSARYIWSVTALMNFKKEKKTYTSIYVSRFKGFATYLSTMRTKMCASQTWNILKKKKSNCFSQNNCGIDKDSLTLKTSDCRGQNVM